MITFIIITAVVLSILDTIIGNYYLPSREQIVKKTNGNKRFMLRRKIRLLFIPIWFWYSGSLHPDSIIWMLEVYANWTLNIRKAHKFRYIEYAEEILNKNRRSNSKILFKEGELKIVFDTFKEEYKNSSKLLEELMSLDREGNEEEALLKLKELQKIHKI